MSEAKKQKVKLNELIDAIKDPEVLGAIMRVALDMSILEDGQSLDKNSIKKTVLKAMGTQSLINKYSKNNTLYIETPNQERVDITKKEQFS